MNRVCVFLCLALLSVSPAWAADSPDYSSAGALFAASGGGGGGAKAPVAMSPLSRIAIGGGISFVSGINLQAATNLSKNFNVRGVGNVFSYTVNNLSTKGFTGSAKLNLASAGVSLDYYPWATHGLRLSPGVLFYNQNGLTGSATMAAGQSFKLNGTTYYSQTAQPVQGTLTLGLNANKPAFTMSIGWGNMISRTGGHWSFPFEIGAAFVGSPTLNATLSGLACTQPTGGTCVNAATDPTVQSNLNAQLAKSRSDINVLQVFPSVSFGVAYSFRIR